MLKIENRTIDIFTDYDESIFSDGSIDPLGLLIIWTSLGNRIFHNRLNSISTNIRSYTLNLFHHHVIRHACLQHQDKFVNLINKPPYHNNTDLYEGLAIFLECLMAHVLVQTDKPIEVSDTVFLPGVSKLQGIMLHDPGNKICKTIPVDRADGILVRQHQLGIHGRHKGPFQQMELFQKQDYYQDQFLWNKISELFESGPFHQLAKELIRIIDTHVLSQRPSGNKAIRVKVNELLTPRLISLYENALQEDNITAPRFTSFWKERLGFGSSNATSTKIYEYVSRSTSDIQSHSSIRAISYQYDDPLLQAIKAVEPFIAMIQKIMERLLTRDTKESTEDLHNFIARHFDNPEVNVGLILPYLRGEFFSAEAINRLRSLINIYTSCMDPFQPQEFIQQLLAFHHAIMKQRGNMPWISISERGDITRHRSFSYSDNARSFQQSYDWVNDYYMSTVISLHNGMRN